MGFTSYSETSGTDFFRYTEYHGKIEKTERRKVLNYFNKIENKLGAQCKIIMISPAGAEGLSLSNVRQVHIMEPYWNEVRINMEIKDFYNKTQYNEYFTNGIEIDKLIEIDKEIKISGEIKFKSFIIFLAFSISLKLLTREALKYRVFKYVRTC